MTASAKLYQAVLTVLEDLQGEVSKDYLAREVCRAVAASQGDGAPDTDVEMLADVIYAHFCSRWGQEVPVSREEALVVASEYNTRRSLKRGEEGDQIPEFTPAMLKAGVDMICEEYGICGADIAPGLARDVFTAMWGQRTIR